ncbi:MAG: SCO1664 family protein [Actinomycetota bacterium]
MTAGDLLSGDLEILGILPDSTNYTFLAHLESGPLVVYKPRRGETPLWDFPPGTLCNRELAAYLVSEAGGWDFVPLTVIRDGPLGEGAVQAYIEHDGRITAFELGEEHEEVLRSIAVFDLVINNADRKGGHVLLDPGGKLWAVDHGICFNELPKLRTVLWDFIGEKLPEADLRRVRALCDAADGSLGAKLGALLAPGEVAALRRRIEAVLRHPQFPPPGPGRPYPWPPV